ncbi:hypothetical protein C8Q80DRAFT_1271511 [Daedaleopsis nitida]|nr:hypothetical protein C8Q80DRAFT_1271511 [Daedaleopsis nitida]
MDPLSAITPVVFRELSRFGHGDHVFYHRTAGDPHSFIEVHADGTMSTFTSPVAALMPNVVIKLQTPMFAQIVSAVKPQQGRTVIRDPHTRLLVADSLADIVGLVQNHKAAVLREGATLVSWSNEIPPALATLFQVHNEVSALLARYDPARAVDPTPLYGSGIVEGTSAMDCFDQFIHNYEPAASADKPHDFSLLAPMAGDSLPPLGTLDSVNSIDSFLSSAIRPNLFDSLASTSNAQSPMLSDSISPANFMSAGVSHLHIHSSPHSPHFATLSPASMSYTFSSPSTSSVILETPIEEHYYGTPIVGHSTSLSIEETTDAPALPDSPAVERIRELVADNHGKRKRTSAAATTPQDDPTPPVASQASGRTRLRRASRSVSPPAPSASSSRVRKSAPSPKKPQAVPTPPAPKRAICPLPGRVMASLRTVTGGSPVSPPMPPKRTLLKTATAARLAAYRATTAACCDRDEHDHDHDDGDDFEKGYYESDADQDSEYEADRSSDDDFFDELVNELDDDDEFRPPKRTRSAGSPPSSPVSSISTVIGPKAVSPKIAKGKRRKGKGRRKSKSKASKKAKKAVLGEGAVAGEGAGAGAEEDEDEDDSAICQWCLRSFTRAGDRDRHIERSCKFSPFHKVDQCPKCFQPMSRPDALLRHRTSGRCAANQRRNAKAAEEAAKEAARQAKKTAKKAAAEVEACEDS